MIKKILIVITLVITTLSAIGQYNLDLADSYLQRSKKQKKAAFITLGCSVVSLSSGMILLAETQPGWERVNWSKALGGTGLVIVGAGLAVSSIVLFISSGENRKKAERIGVFINKPIPVNTGVTATVLPYSIGLTVRIR